MSNPMASTCKDGNRLSYMVQIDSKRLDARQGGNALFPLQVQAIIGNTPFNTTNCFLALSNRIESFKFSRNCIQQCIVLN